MSSMQSGSSARTRQAIIDAAGELLAQRPAASLAEIAEAARVGRSTLHRHFPDRAGLISTLIRHLADRVDRVIAEAALDQGTAKAALHRLLHGYFELGPGLMFALAETRRSQDEQLHGAMSAADRSVARLLERGRAEGEFDCALTADWTRRALWFLLAATWDAVGAKSMSRHEAVDTMARTLERGILDQHD
ncbi:AcrR family transcriptional regulator [Actinoalloteichus hymeniacidonis]|nr:AcrR family transcriptional regulator [Actinoalloteichus hymeniacidonis]